MKQGADLIVRLNPFSVVLFDQQQQPVALCATLKRQNMETIRPLAVVLQSPCGQHTVRGLVHAYRLSAEQAGRARQPQTPGRIERRSRGSVGPVGRAQGRRADGGVCGG